MPHNRPRDRDLAKQLVRELRREADLPVVFLGIGGQAGVTIDEGVGLRRDGVRGVNVVPGEGLGGRVLRDRRPAVVADYGVSRTITDSYLDQVRSEGLGPVMAVPVLSGIGETRMVLYGAHRERFEFGDRIRSVAMRLATKAGTELRIRDEVDRRIAMVQRGTAGIREAGRGRGRRIWSDCASCTPTCGRSPRPRPTPMRATGFWPPPAGSPRCCFRMPGATGRARAMPGARKRGWREVGRIPMHRS